MDNFPGPEEEWCGPGDRDSLLLGLRQQPETLWTDIPWPERNGATNQYAMALPQSSRWPTHAVRKSRCRNRRKIRPAGQSWIEVSALRRRS